MQDYSQLMARPTGTLQSIAVSTAVNTLTPPERHGSAPGREYCPRKAATRPADSLYRYRGGTKVGSAFTSALPIPEAIPAQSQELVVWTDPSGAGQPSRACSQSSCTCELKATSSTF